MENKIVFMLMVFILSQFSLCFATHNQSYDTTEFDAIAIHEDGGNITIRGQEVRAQTLVVLDFDTSKCEANSEIRNRKLFIKVHAIKASVNCSCSIDIKTDFFKNFTISAGKGEVLMENLSSSAQIKLGGGSVVIHGAMPNLDISAGQLSFVASEIKTPLLNRNVDLSFAHGEAKFALAKGTSVKATCLGMLNLEKNDFSTASASGLTISIKGATGSVSLVSE
jgi:hypothetical protein